MSENSDTLVVEGLSGGYDRFDVIHDIAFRVGRGEAVALLGPNGAGKTTIMRALTGLLARRRGRVEIDGVDVGSLPPHRIARGHAAMVPEGRRLFVGQSVEDNLRLGGLRHRRDRERTEQLLESVFELFPVVERYRRREATALSGGEQQMVAIGRMMMSDPSLMLLDEPSLGLAPLAIADLSAALRRLRERDHSILLVEQRVDLALEVCDRVYVVYGGRIVDEGRADDIGAEGRALIDAYLG
ncbi:ABC transporter ATP-binding protein [Protaetiibacter intestinalis]|uniref:ABC transporter ATP-binding protein n=1 Tax=Protaetiibacter intestinalis TaxID=2419774 RepID=A0A387BCI7_9MICO|nr:ABC transporter ATP-binding protein [Protaetiibacter intestinalis]AYF98816.1 ABC transporter ATP-binding protein [Protaetiibacter intestinalis]